jgi:hypothetical protein
MIHVKVARPVSHQSSGVRIVLCRVDRRQTLPCREFGDGPQIPLRNAVQSDHECLGALLRCGIECLSFAKTSSDLVDERPMLPRHAKNAGGP